MQYSVCMDTHRLQLSAWRERPRGCDGNGGCVLNDFEDLIGDEGVERIQLLPDLHVSIGVWKKGGVRRMGNQRE